MIDELDLVVLKRDLPTERLAVGSVGQLGLDGGLVFQPDVLS
jgi:hypothetical protein